MGAWRLLSVPMPHVTEKAMKISDVKATWLRYPPQKLSSMSAISAAWRRLT
jgi:hypothetical protein